MKRKPEEADCYFNRAQDAIDDVGGRYALPEPRRRIIGRDAYPEVSPTPLTSPQPDHAYDPSRDRIEEQDVTGMTFGLDVSGKSPQQPPPAANSDGAASPSPAAPSTFRRRF